MITTTQPEINTTRPPTSTSRRTRQPHRPTPNQPLSRHVNVYAAAAGVTFFGTGGAVRAQSELASLGGRYAGIVNALGGPELAGLVDMHTHPAAHLGFGTELFYGAPDGDPGSTMNNCNPFHGGWGFDNQRGNQSRRIVAD